jgi:hypothetical protein
MEESSPGRSAQLAVTSQRPGCRSGTIVTLGSIGKCLTHREMRPDGDGSIGPRAAIFSARRDSIFWMISR